MTGVARFGLALAGVRARRSLSLLLAAVGVLAVLVAAGSVLYGQAASDSSLRSRLAAAPAADAALLVIGNSSSRSEDPLASVDRAFPALPHTEPAVDRLSVELRLPVRPGVDESQAASLTYVDEVCRHVRLLSGRCPAAPGEVLLPAAQAAAGWRAGQQLVGTELAASPDNNPRTFAGDVHYPEPEGVPPRSPEVRLTVTGLYDVLDPSARFWDGVPPALDDPLVPSTVLTVAATLRGLPEPVLLGVRRTQRLRLDAVRTADVRDVLARAQSLPLGITPVLSGLPELYGQQQADRQLLVRDLQVAAALALVVVAGVLAVVLAAALRARRPELTAAALSGQAPWRTALGLAALPALALSASTVLGLVLAPLAVRALARAQLRHGTPVPSGTRASLLAGAGVGVLACLLALGLALRAATRPVQEVLAPQEARSRRAGALELAVGLLALLGLAELVLARLGRAAGSPWSLLTPATAALAAGLLLPALVRPAAERAVRATAPRDPDPRAARPEPAGRLPAFLAARELRRDGAAWRGAALACVAASVVVSGVLLQQAAAVDRQQRAGLVVGAPLVWDVRPDEHLLDRVRSADPAGRWAMAAVQVTPYGSRQSRVLAVDSRALAAVAGWDPARSRGPDPARLRALLHPAAPVGAPVPDPLPVVSTALPVGERPLALVGVDGADLPGPEVRGTTALLPRLLDAGSLVDLEYAARLAGRPGITSALVQEQVWLGRAAPANATARLQRAGVQVRAVTRRSAAARATGLLPPALGLEAQLAVAALVTLLVATATAAGSSAGAAHRRTQALALEEAGVPAAAVRRARALGAGARLMLAVALGTGCALLTTALGSGQVPLAAPGTLPGTRFVLVPGPGVLAALLVLALLGAVEAVALLRSSRRSGRARALREAPL